MIKTAKTYWFLGIVFTIAVLTLVSAVSGSRAAPLPQPTPFKTPTPGSDGKIFYTVQAEDTLWSIAAIAGISVGELRAINNMHPNESIRPGQQIFLGMGGPALITPTAGPTQAPPTPTITPTPESGTSRLCVLLYDDSNGDSLRQEEEPVVPNGAISVVEKNGKFNKSEETKPGIDPLCFEDIPPGDYNISVAIPEGYNPTTNTNYAIKIKAGDNTYVDFGAQSRLKVTPLNTNAPDQPAPSSTGTSPVLGVMGAFFLILGIGLAIYAARLRR